MHRIQLLPLGYAFGDMELTIYPVLLQDDKELILVDCGYPEYLGKIEKKLQEMSLSLNSVTKLLITHHDHDHMGAMSAIKEKYPHIEVLCSQEQASFLTGQSKSIRLVQTEAIQGSLPEDEKKAGLAFIDLISSMKPIKEVTIVNPGDVLPCCGGVEIVDTKGHMPGHISLYIRKEKTLISGDALIIKKGKLAIALPEYAVDIKEAQESVRRLLNYDIDRIICYHGGIYDKDIRSSLLGIIRDFDS